MPELPDIVVYVEALQKRILNPPLQRVRMAHPFLLRTAEPPLAVVENKRVIELQRPIQVKPDAEMTVTFRAKEEMKEAASEEAMDDA